MTSNDYLILTDLRGEFVLLMCLEKNEIVIFKVEVK